MYYIFNHRGYITGRHSGYFNYKSAYRALCQIRERLENEYSQALEDGWNGNLIHSIRQAVV